MRNLLSALAASPRREYLPVRQLHESIGCRVWLVRSAEGQFAVLRIGRTAAASRDLEREAGYLRYLLHPSLPRLLEAYRSSQGFCLVTTAFDGLSLGAIAQRTGRPLPLGLVLAWAEEACAALSYLHTGPLPLVHRDLHPGHLILQIAPVGGRVGSIGLIDFGAALPLSSGGDATGSAGAPGSGSLGTAGTLGGRLPGSAGSLGGGSPDTQPPVTARLGHPEYAAPEQFLATPLPPDPRTDVYGLAAAVYRLMSGRGPVRPFEFARLHALDPAVPEAVDAVLQRALSPDPTRRYETAAAFGRALADLRASLHPFAASPRTNLTSFLTTVELTPEELAALQQPLPALQHPLPSLEHPLPALEPGPQPGPDLHPEPGLQREPDRQPGPQAAEPQSTAARPGRDDAAPRATALLAPVAPAAAPSAPPPASRPAHRPHSPLSPAKTAAARVAADVVTMRPERTRRPASAAATETAATAMDAPTDDPLPSRRERRRRVAGVTWLAIVALLAVGIWATLRFSGTMM